MTTPYGAHYPTPATSPIVASAGAVIASARRGIALPAPFPPPVRPAFTDEDRKAIGEVVDKGGLCRCCAGIHAGGELACPRLASFELDGDGKLKAGSFWRSGEWDAGRVVFPEDAAEEAPGD